MTTVKARVDCEIYLSSSQVDSELQAFIEHELSFPNPKIPELLRMGYSIWRVPKKIICYRKLKSGWYLPLGFGPRLYRYLESRGDQLELDDRRVDVPVSPFTCRIKLKSEQARVKAKLLAKNRVVLEAKPGFGKTMTAIDLIATRAQKTIIIVHTRALLSQWQKRFTDFCDLADGDLGIIGEGKWQVGRLVTIASYQTLLSRGTKDLQNEFGFVVVDECHHVPAKTFAKVVRGFAARYCLGLTATPYRKDRLDKLMTFYIGPLVPTTAVTSDDQTDMLPPNRVPTKLVWRLTDTTIPHAEEKEFTELGTQLISDTARLSQVVADVCEACRCQGKIIVLSERVGHAQGLYDLLRQNLPDIPMVLITGQTSREEREQLLQNVKHNQFQIMVATGGVVGEGFDWPAADHLFLTFPFSWKGKLIQYVGRVQRVCEGKTGACVYDYVDANLGIFRAMSRKRAAAYRELGIEVPAQL